MTCERLANQADVLLTDGSVAVIRSLGPDDHPAVRALHARASDESLFRRFFSVGRASADFYLARLENSIETTALVAVVDGSVVALATAEPVDVTTEEVAFLVDDALAGRGLGSLLLEHLAADARGRDIRRFVADVLVENRAMLGVFLDAGFEVGRHSDQGVVTVELDTEQHAERSRPRPTPGRDAARHSLSNTCCTPTLWPWSASGGTGPGWGAPC